MNGFANMSLSENASLSKDIFYLNPTYQYMMTGQRNYGYLWSKIGWSGIITAVFLLILAGAFVPPFINEMRLITMPTNTTEGRVVDTRISSGKSTTYYLTYSFSVNNAAYQREESISRDEYYQRKDGDWVTITYVKADPNSSHLGLSGLHWKVISPFVFVIGFFLIFGLIAFLGDRPRRVRVARLRRDGQLIFGQLMASNGVEVRRGSGKSRRIDYDVTIYYQFMNPDHKRLDQQAIFVRNDLKKKELQTRGSVAVLYISDSDFMVL
ncbi:MAG: DUF3592 domain-containing protein [Chloroflexi bacterium]|nr:DUF3592 domain-containing protein [Chloroflexota bacterium]MCC6891995.1 DUF3592 domain-containing protein [Anaerolineae bacterium]